MIKEIFIPQLGQTVEEVIILDWLAADGCLVEPGQAILEVETDKATFPIEADARGTLHKGPYKVGEVVPVLTVVAIIGEPNDQFGLVQNKPGSNQDKSQLVIGNNASQIEPMIVTSSPEPKLEGRQFISPRARHLARQKKVDLALVLATGNSGKRVIEKDVINFINQLPLATPLAKKIAAEKGIRLDEIRGTGTNGRITQSDVEEFLKDFHSTEKSSSEAIETSLIELPSLQDSKSIDANQHVEAQVSSAAPSISKVSRQGVIVSKVWRIMAERITQSWTSVPHFYLQREVNASNFIVWNQTAQKGSEVNITYTDLLVKVVAAALRRHPRLNSMWNEDKFLLNEDINIGIAVAIDDGLVVPVIHNADKLCVREIAASRKELVTRAQAGKLRPEDISEGTFTISNLGMYGVDVFNAIVNPPQAAILAVGRIAERVVPVDGHPGVQLMMTLSLSCDHRIVDGARGALFLDNVAIWIQEPLGLL